MAIFRCKRSGNTVTFRFENDIESMRKHEGYEEVKDEKEIRQETPKEVLKLKRKANLPDFLKE